jgi:hypothetical protein
MVKKLPGKWQKINYYFARHLENYTATKAGFLPQIKQPNEAIS